MLSGSGVERPGGRLVQVEGVMERYIADLSSRVQLSRPIRVVAACGNGTAGAFAPEPNPEEIAWEAEAADRIVGGVLCERSGDHGLVEGIEVGDIEPTTGFR